MVNSVHLPSVSANERISVRFGASLVGNVLRAGFSFLCSLLIARTLGASHYGDLHFLLSSFAALSMLLEMGTSTAFYTFISRKPRRSMFFTLFSLWIVLQFLITLSLITVLLPEKYITRVWVGHERNIILLAFIANFLMTQVWGMLVHMGEAARKTVFVQKISVFQVLMHLVLILVAAQGGWLTVRNIMIFLIVEYVLIVGVFMPKLLRENILRGEGDNESIRQIWGGV